MPTNTSNMNLIIPTIGTDSGLTWEQSMNANSYVVDNHNHSAGQGTAIPPAGLNINSALTFNGNSATHLLSVVFDKQSSVATLDAIYVKSDGNLYYNDGAGNVVQITTGGAVNATSSGITSGTNSASFVANVLVVNEDTSKPANIKCASLLIGNNVTSTHYLTLQPPNAMAADYSVTLPAIPGSQSFMTVDTSGNMSGYASISGGLVGSNLANATVTGSKIASGTITATNITAGTITGTEMASNVNLSGKNVKANSNDVIVCNTNPATNALAIIRGSVDSSGTPTGGEGFTCSRDSQGVYTFTFNNTFLASTDDIQVLITVLGDYLLANITNQVHNGFTVHFEDAGHSLADAAFNFMAIGQRA